MHQNQRIGRPRVTHQLLYSAKNETTTPAVRTRKSVSCKCTHSPTRQKLFGQVDKFGSLNSKRLTLTAQNCCLQKMHVVSSILAQESRKKWAHLKKVMTPNKTGTRAQFSAPSALSPGRPVRTDRFSFRRRQSQQLRDQFTVGA